jgi:hypothetical protein
MAERSELAVIGSGPRGQKATIHAATRCVLPGQRLTLRSVEWLDIDAALPHHTNPIQTRALGVVVGSDRNSGPDQRPHQTNPPHGLPCLR